ncbi:beta-lactamase family protein [Dactylosporangium sp. NBC_01737]|uniref:serine hydrolase domain-containing protein n=1 Tax=Dactylosporangium sp. NBC_01737 TaxID=2975959 RepID=UPI002E0DAFF8|nr:beta-lactamase family protein [Dactylosporangium sp. NBC_01737]
MERTAALMERAPVPAVGVSVFDRGGVLFQEVRGVADLTTGRPATAEDWWDLASLTKVLVTLPQVLLLCDAGRLDLDRSLGEQWERAAGAPVKDATIRQLLAHNAGLRPTVEFFRFARGREAIVDAALATPLVSAPGGVAAYSDLGFLLLGELVRELGAPLPAPGLRFPPLPGPAVATEECRWRGRLISGEIHDENAWAMGGQAGHAGAFGTLDLVTAAGRGWLADQVVSQALHDQAKQCWAGNGLGERFGLGWWLAPTRDVAGASAGPGSFGATGFVGNRLWFEPDRGYGVVVLSNRIHPVRDADRAPFQAWTHELFAAIADEV